MVGFFEEKTDEIFAKARTGIYAGSLDFHLLNYSPDFLISDSSSGDKEYLLFKKQEPFLLGVYKPRIIEGMVGTVIISYDKILNEKILIDFQDNANIFLLDPSRSRIEELQDCMEDIIKGYKGLFFKFINQDGKLY